MLYATFKTQVISFIGFAAGRGMRLLIRREQSRISEQ